MKNTNQPLNHEQILLDLALDCVLEATGHKKSEVLSKKRHRPLVFARQYTAALLRKHTTLTLKSIGMYFSADHSTIVNSISQFEAASSYDKAYTEEYKNIEIVFIDRLTNVLDYSLEKYVKALNINELIDRLENILSELKTIKEERDKKAKELIDKKNSK
jgi:hypothetical protein